jgi:hypothetical protein
VNNSKDSCSLRTPIETKLFFAADQEADNASACAGMEHELTVELLHELASIE